MCVFRFRVHGVLTLKFSNMGNGSSQQVRISEPVKYSSIPVNQIIHKSTPGHFKRQLSRRSLKRRTLRQRPLSTSSIPVKLDTPPLKKVLNTSGYYESGCRTLPREVHGVKTSLGTKSVSFSNLTQIVRSPTLYSESTAYSSFVPPSFEKSFVRYKSPNPGTLERRYKTRNHERFDQTQKGRSSPRFSDWCTLCTH